MQIAPHRPSVSVGLMQWEQDDMLVLFGYHQRYRDAALFYTLSMQIDRIANGFRDGHNFGYEHPTLP